MDINRKLSAKICFLYNFSWISFKTQYFFVGGHYTRNLFINEFNQNFKPITQHEPDVYIFSLRCQLASIKYCMWSIIIHRFSTFFPIIILFIILCIYTMRCVQTTDWITFSPRFSCKKYSYPFIIIITH